MQRDEVEGIAALAILLVVSVAIKLSGIIAPTEPDQASLRDALVSAMAIGGYDASGGTGNWWGSGLVSAQRGDCTVSLRDATHNGPDWEAVTSQRMNEGRPIRYIRRGEYLPSYPRITIEAEWRFQRELSRLGWIYPIDPVIAVGAREGCWPDAGNLREVELFYR